jgi:hypothetical protein
MKRIIKNGIWRLTRLNNRKMKEYRLLKKLIYCGLGAIMRVRYAISVNILNLLIYY